MDPDTMDAKPILLVEDDADDVTLTKRVIASARLANPLHQVSTVRGARTYLERARSRAQLPALIVLDLGLPDGSGYDLMSWVRGEPAPLRSIPVVVVSVSGTLYDEQRSTKLGALVHLRKPVEPDLLIQAIVQLGLRLPLSDPGGSRTITGG